MDSMQMQLKPFIKQKKHSEPPKPKWDSLLKRTFPTLL